MQRHPVRSRVALMSRVLWVVALLAVVSSCAVATAANSPRVSLAGRWAGKYSGAFSGTFTIQWTQTGSKLSGTITLSRPKGKYGITGSVTGRGGINFGAVDVGATYTGAVSGTKMSGRYQTPQGGGSWSAHKCKSRTLC